MMHREWSAVLSRYGQPAVLSAPEQEDMTVKAFLHPVLDREDQLPPSSLGLRREERVLYLGPGEVPLYPRKTVVTWNGQQFSVRSTRSVGDGHHVWAILQALEGDA